MGRRWLLAVAILSAPAMAAEQQFDLICTAKRTTVRYRVDLNRGEWCDGECGTPQRLAEVTPGSIILERHQKAYARDRESRTEISRSSGEWNTFIFDPERDVVPFDRQGRCDKAAFSGFPAAKF